MKKTNHFNKYQNQFGKEKVFSFKGSDFLFILIGYPVWKAFIVSSEINLSLEVTPKIDFKKQIITIPEREIKHEKKTKSDKPSKKITYFSKSELEQLVLFFKLVPQEIIDLVINFSDSHWEIVKAIIHLDEKFITLIKINPALAYLTVSLEKFNPSYSIYNDSIFYIEKILLKKQKKILEFALFTSTEQNVRIISKLELPLISIKNLELVRNFLRSEITEKKRILKLLSHQKTINAKHFDLIFKNYKLLNLLSFKAINEIVNFNEYKDKIKVLNSIKRYSKYTKPQLPLVKTIKTIDSVLITVKKAELERREKEDKFPAPPILGTKNIIPIKTKRELNYWSKRQINCIHDYAKSIKTNKNYFYKVILGNEEASLQLVLNKGKIKVGSFLATRNKDVSYELREVVERWMKENT